MPQTADTYTGPSLLRFSSQKLSLDPEIPVFKREAMVKHKQKIQLEQQNKPRRSERIKNNHANRVLTIWKPSSLPSHLAMNYHQMSLPTHIVAEPSTGLKELGNDILRNNIKVIKSNFNNSNYIAYVDIINHLLSPNSSSRDWEAQWIEKHLEKQGQIWVKVLWKTGYKSWVKLEMIL